MDGLPGALFSSDARGAARAVVWLLRRRPVCSGDATTAPPCCDGILAAATACRAAPAMLRANATTTTPPCCDKISVATAAAPPCCEPVLCRRRRDASRCCVGPPCCERCCDGLPVLRRRCRATSRGCKGARVATKCGVAARPPELIQQAELLRADAARRVLWPWLSLSNMRDVCAAFSDGRKKRKENDLLTSMEQLAASRSYGSGGGCCFTSRIRMAPSSRRNKTHLARSSSLYHASRAQKSPAHHKTRREFGFGLLLYYACVTYILLRTIHGSASIRSTTTGRSNDETELSSSPSSWSSRSTSYGPNANFFICFQQS